MLIDTSAGDIVYTSLFTGVHGNYLQPQRRSGGPRPGQPADGDKSKMNFGSTGKAWRDIWSAGHGVGSIADVPTVAECVARLREEYATGGPRTHAAPSIGRRRSHVTLRHC